MMRVLVLLTDLFDATGGIQTFNRALVKALDEIASARGWAVTLLVLNDSGRSPMRFQYLSGNRTEYVAFGRRRGSFALASLRVVRRAELVLFGHMHFVPLLLPMRLFRPTVAAYLTVHGIEVWKRLSWPCRTGASRVNRILSVSAATADQMCRHNPIPRDRFSLLPNTVDPLYGKNAASPRWTRADLALPSGRIILSVSRLDASDWYKRIDLVIQAMPAVLREVPDANYIVVGDGTDRRRLEDLARASGVQGRVVFAGRVSDDRLPSYYHNCDVFVLPSEEEGFGIVFLEAMYHAKPCIGVRAGGVPEVIEEGTTGFLVDPGDPTAMADILIRVLRDESLRHATGRAGKSRTDGMFSFDAFRMRLETALCS